MIKLIINFLLAFTLISFNSSYCQKNKKDTTKVDTTIQDALDFIKANFDQTNKYANNAFGDSFTDYFYTEESYVMNYDYDGDFTYTFVSADQCEITFIETLSSKTKISFSEDNDRPEETPYYSVFGNTNQDTIKIDFSKISRIESDRFSITFVTYNNMDLIEHSGTITRTPPKKRKNDLLRFFKEEEKDLYKKTTKFLKDNKMNYDVYPEQTESYNYKANRFTIQNIEREKCKRLVKAFTFLQQNCGVPKEKF